MSELTANKLPDSANASRGRGFSYVPSMVNYRDTGVSYQVLVRQPILDYGGSFVLDDLNTIVNSLDEVSFELLAPNANDPYTYTDIDDARLYAFGWRFPTDEEMAAIVVEERRTSRAVQREFEELIRDHPHLTYPTDIRAK